MRENPLHPSVLDSISDDAPVDDTEYQAARRRVLGPWGAEIRERLRLAEIAIVPQQSRRIHWPGPGPTGPSIHVNRPSVSRATARRHSLQERRANKAAKVVAIPLNAPLVRHERSIVVKLAEQIRGNINRENPK